METLWTVVKLIGVIFLLSALAAWVQVTFFPESAKRLMDDENCPPWP